MLILLSAMKDSPLCRDAFWGFNCKGVSLRGEHFDNADKIL